jgi:hypothetical protein
MFGALPTIFWAQEMVADLLDGEHSVTASRNIRAVLARV